MGEMRRPLTVVSRDSPKSLKLKVPCTSNYYADGFKGVTIDIVANLGQNSGQQESSMLAIQILRCYSCGRRNRSKKSYPKELIILRFPIVGVIPKRKTRNCFAPHRKI